MPIQAFMASSISRRVSAAIHSLRSTMINTYSIVRGGAAAVRLARSAGSQKEFSVLVALDDEYPGLPSLSPTPAKATNASITTLKNGLTIVTEDSCTLSTATLTFPYAGSSSETTSEHGAAFFNKSMNFKSGSGMSSILINRTIEDEGGMPFSKVDRKGATVGFTVAPERAVGLIPLLATHCSFEKWDVRDAFATAKYEADVASITPTTVLNENLFAAAFGPQSSMGRSFYYPGASKDTIAAFRERSYVLNGAILSTTGVKDHASFVSKVEGLMGDSSVAGESSKPPAIYLGGESRVHSPTASRTYVALAFQAPASSVIASVVKHYFTLAGAQAGVTGFYTSGVIGVQADSKISQGIADSLIATVSQSVTPELVKRAKTLAKSEALQALDGGSKLLADVMTSSILESGTFVPAAISKSYDSVSEAQIKEALMAILKSNPSLAACGDISLVPYHATIASAFK